MIVVSSAFFNKLAFGSVTLVLRLPLASSAPQDSSTDWGFGEMESTFIYLLIYCKIWESCQLREKIK